MKYPKDKKAFFLTQTKPNTPIYCPNCNNKLADTIAYVELPYLDENHEPQKCTFIGTSEGHTCKKCGKFTVVYK